MPFWRKKKPAPLEPERRYRPEYMTVRDIAEHPGTSGYVRIDEPNRGGLTGFVVASTVSSRIGISPEGQPWITDQGTVCATPMGTPWAYVAHVAGEGLTVFFPDEWGKYVALLADNPPDRWIPAAPGKDPGDVKPRGISAPDGTEQ
ncbi:hypothetical protein [Streptomyces cylindrosporus]|uniref:Uncharacterized protein n=1 Tax=Streptomyces cylindrosporus TaxID=2927583 RepID=A0ABS9YPK9_9ACTN|nr:hypothetical protein [Streptomyces cylindrosporus]MCI3279201.1 hypothetical protein [Streptomyces cylindrosporus]